MIHYLKNAVAGAENVSMLPRHDLLVSTIIGKTTNEMKIRNCHSNEPAESINRRSQLNIQFSTYCAKLEPYGTHQTNTIVSPCTVVGPSAPDGTHDQSHLQAILTRL